jgi:putative RNA 2'-phosphotransferase
MNSKQIIQTSKFLSLVLRHKPEQIGITLDEAGWADARELLDAMARHRSAISMADLREIVATSDKKRFEFNADESRIRASQGHSVEVELGYAPVEPPEELFHGTFEDAVESIRRAGISKGQRHHVHLSKDAATAANVGQRRGRPAILTIRARQMHDDGMKFFVSTNGVWLTDHVPPHYINFPAETP